MQNEVIKAGKAGGFLAWAYAVCDWLMAIPLDKWVTIFALIGGMCATAAYLFDIRKKRLEIRLIEQQLNEDGDE